MTTTPPSPLSPHLQIYKPQLTSLMSITHRATGIFLSLGTLVLVYWLMSIAAGPSVYQHAQQLLHTWPSLLLLFAWSFSLFYHLCNGIRHLFWDAGYGFTLKATYRSGYLVIAATLLLTTTAWITAFVINGVL